MDLVPTVIQVGLCMYSVAEVQLRFVYLFQDAK